MVVAEAVAAAPIGFAVIVSVADQTTAAACAAVTAASAGRFAIATVPAASAVTASAVAPTIAHACAAAAAGNARTGRNRPED